MFSAILPSETTLRVTKRDFRNVGKFELTSDRPGYVITGPTGSGKTTFALLPVLKKLTKGALLIEPTQANNGNVVSEFQTTMPPIVRDNYKAYYPYPQPTVGRERTRPGTQFNLVTIAEFRRDLAQPAFLKNYDVVILDEYHQISQDMFDVLAFLRSAREYIRKYILISATPGMSVTEPSFGPDVKMSPARFPLTIMDMPKRAFLNSSYNATHYMKRGNGCVVVVMPNAVYVDRYRQMLQDMGVTVFIIDKGTTQVRYRQIQSYIGLAPMVIILDPAVEAGITLKMSVLINPGYTFMINYDGAVISETYRALTPQESAQRAGRAGRGIVTQYIYNTSLEGIARTDPTEYLVANTYILIKAHAMTLPNVPASVFDRFKRLKAITVSTAREVLKDNSIDPIVAAYKYNERGILYKECGGTASGFFEASADDLKVFYYRGGYAIAPVFSLVNLSFDPFQLLAPNKQGEILARMVDACADALGKLSTGRRVEILRESMDVYINDFIASIKLVLDTDRRSSYTSGNNPSTLRDIFNDVGHDIASLFEAAAMQPGYVLGFDQERRDDDKVGNIHWLSTPTEKLYLTPKSHYVKNSTLVRRPFMEAIVNALRNEINVAALSTVANKSVNLEKYRKVAPSGHEWYREYVLKKKTVDKSVHSIPNANEKDSSDDQVESADELAFALLRALQPINNYRPDYTTLHKGHFSRPDDLKRPGNEHITEIGLKLLEEDQSALEYEACMLASQTVFREYDRINFGK